MDEKSILSFPEWLSEIDKNIESKIHSIVKANSINKEQAKNLLRKKLKEVSFLKRILILAK